MAARSVCFAAWKPRASWDPFGAEAARAERCSVTSISRTESSLCIAFRWEPCAQGRLSTHGERPSSGRVMSGRCGTGEGVAATTISRWSVGIGVGINGSDESEHCGCTRAHCRGRKKTMISCSFQTVSPTVTAVLHPNPNPNPHLTPYFTPHFISHPQRLTVSSSTTTLDRILSNYLFEDY